MRRIIYFFQFIHQSLLDGLSLDLVKENWQDMKIKSSSEIARVMDQIKKHHQ